MRSALNAIVSALNPDTLCFPNGSENSSHGFKKSKLNEKDLTVSTLTLLPHAIKLQLFNTVTQ